MLLQLYNSNPILLNRFRIFTFPSRGEEDGKMGWGCNTEIVSESKMLQLMRKGKDKLAMRGHTEDKEVLDHA